ncbi:MAG: PH domain-containing protein [Pirellulales bacterium]|nr:PH domain-containing protein [Pirellulales bacterium]
MAHFMTNTAISGVAPPEAAEVTIMTVSPSIAEFKLGQMIGRGCRAGGGGAFSVGNLVALASIPAALGLFFWSLRPWAVKRYRLTNRRIVIQKGTRQAEDAGVALDQFDRVEINVQPGQEWYPAGDLVLYHGPVECLRLLGVPHPESFRHTLLKAHVAFTGVQEALEAHEKELTAAG